MSTYNGERFLREQLDSILFQKNVELQVVIRDDGSTDSTVDILNEYQDRNLIRWYTDDINLGPARSFMQLLTNAPECDFYAFADQDDYWQNDKIVTAIKNIEKKNELSLYASIVQPVNEKLQPLEKMHMHYLQTFGESLVHRYVSGCTMVFTKKMRDIITRYNPQFLPMHDVWIYNIAQAIGADIYFDYTPHILYRLHGNNVIGKSSFVDEWKRRYIRFTNKQQIRYRIAKQLLDNYSDLITEENLNLLRLFVAGKTNLKKRIILAMDKRLKCADTKTYRLFQLSVLLNMY